MKRKKTLKILICVAVCAMMLFSFGIFASASEGEAVGTAVAEESIFDEIYSLIMENSADILSLLSFIASITVALFYKFALSPMLRGGLDKIAGGVKNISGESAKGYEALLEGQRALEEENGKIKAMLQSTLEVLKDNAGEERMTLEKSLLCVMGAQVNMLNEIFQSSALPVYQKEAVGNMINEMKSELAKNEARVEKV